MNLIIENIHEKKCTYVFEISISIYMHILMHYVHMYIIYINKCANILANLESK